MAAAGNVVGLRRLLGRYRQLHKAVRGRLEGRLKHEVERAQRLQVSLLEMCGGQPADQIV